MTEPTISLEPATSTDLERVESLLAANDLPSEDVGSGPAVFFLAYADGEFVGVGGLEVQGTAGLLRSVVVAEAARGEGLGAELCAALESHAREEGVEALYLLTTTAEGFFRRCGYGAIARDAAPSAIRRTVEFRELCPDSATCLYKEL